MQVLENQGPSTILADAALGIAPATYRRPVLRSGTIARDALTARLVAATEARFVVICAPAGYGKTTTTTLWDDADDRAFAWVQLDRRDNDPVHLLQHIGLALDTVDSLDEKTARTLAGVSRPVETELLPALVRELEGRPSFVLVLDDVHEVSSSLALRVLGGLMTSVPSSCQIVLACRSLPDLGMARRRMSGELLELSDVDLRMSSEEANRLLANSGTDLGAEDRERLIEETEGWPGGLFLAALAARRPGRDSSGRERLSVGNRMVADYLIEEVLDGLDPALSEFLLHSSILDEMDGPLLDEFLETKDSAQRLGDLRRSGNLFLIPLDDDHCSYRYHHLFGGILRGRLRSKDPATATHLERRASQLLEARRDIDGAIRHAISANDTERVGDLIFKHAARFAFGGRAERLGQWLALLDPELGDTIPTIALAWLWYAVATGDVERLARGIETADRLSLDGPLPDGSPSVEVAVSVIRAVVSAWGLPGVIDDTERVRAAGRTGNAWWGVATGMQGTVYSMLGDLERARQLLLEGLPDVTVPAFEAGALAHLALLDLHDGDLATADRRSSRSLAIVARHHLEGIVPSVIVYAVASLVDARSGRHAEARQHTAMTRRTLARMGELSPRIRLFCYVALAQAAIVLGDFQLARSLVAEAERAQRSEQGAIFLNEQLDELRTRLDQGTNAGTLEVETLTPAELRVLAHLPTHHSLHDIASELFISRNTAKSHTVAIYRKLSVSSRSDAVVAARRLGMLD